MMSKQQEMFEITSVCRNDIKEAFGFPKVRKRVNELAQQLTDEQMKRLAEYIAQQLLDDIYWRAINDWMNEEFGEKLDEGI